MIKAGQVYARVALAAVLLAAAWPLRADTLFISSFGGGSITRIDLDTGISTLIVSGLELPEDGANGVLRATPMEA